MKKIILFLIMSIIFFSCSRVKEVTKEMEYEYTPDVIIDSASETRYLYVTPDCEEQVKSAIDSIANLYQVGQTQAGDKWKIEYYARLKANKELIKAKDSIKLLCYELKMRLQAEPKKDTLKVNVKVKEIKELTFFENIQLKTWWGLLGLCIITSVGIWLIIKKRA